MLSAPATPAVADSPQTANRDRRRKRLRDNRCFAISAASAPPPCNISYCCGVSCGFIGGVVILLMTPFLAWDKLLRISYTWMYLYLFFSAQPLIFFKDLTSRCRTRSRE